MNPDVLANWTLCLFFICMSLIMILGTLVFSLGIINVVKETWKDIRNEKASITDNR